MTPEEQELVESLKAANWEPGRSVSGALAAILQERDEAKARVKELEKRLARALADIADYNRACRPG